MGNCFNHEDPPPSQLQRRTESQMSHKINDKKKVCLRDFLSLGEIGRGNFGKVLRVKMKSIEREYAMKVIKKSNIIKYGLVEHAMLEKNVLGLSKNPFVIKLKYSFQTEQKLYLVMELVTGGQLLRVIQKQPEKRLSNFQAQFCTAEVVLGLEYMHEELKVIYRDLKPENILVTEQGHLKLTDFGLSKKYDTIDSKFYTFAGTPEYLAPEILSGKGHNYPVDWWCLGILIYEMLTGQTPFHDCSNNFNKIERNIKDGQFIFPNYIEIDAKDLIIKLLDQDPMRRLGVASINQIKNHQFFHDINWDDIYHQRVPSPLIMQHQPTQIRSLQQTRRIFETPCSHTNQTQGEFGGFSVYNRELE